MILTHRPVVATCLFALLSAAAAAQTDVRSTTSIPALSTVHAATATWNAQG